MNRKILIFVALLSMVANAIAARHFSRSISLGDIDTQNLNWRLQTTLSQNIPGAQEGIALALSADGSTLAVGAWFFKNTGATQVYVKSGSTWKHQATLSQNIADAQEGTSVALSADGTILAVGTINNSVITYVRSGSTWRSLAPIYEEGSGAVALSSNGTTLAVGDTGLGYENEGGTYIFIQSGNNIWRCETMLTQNSPQSYEGAAVALSADGATLAAGAFSYRLLSGATQIYVKSRNKWQHQATLSKNLMQADEGISVALSADGNTLASGADMYNAAGGTMIYVRSGDDWKFQAILSQNILSSYEGGAVALSADGNILAAGAQKFGNTDGAVHIYTRNNKVWNHETTLTQASKIQEGTSVALSSNATTLAAGAPYSTAGEAFVYIEEQ